MTIGDRIKEFGKTKFGTMTAFSNELDMTPGSLYSYLNNRSLPGTPILMKLHKMGCDLNWLFGEEVGLVKEPTATYSAGNEAKQLREEVKELRKVINQMQKLIEQAKK